MKKEDILKVSREENKYSDERDMIIDNKAFKMNNWGLYIGLVIVYIINMKRGRMAGEILFIISLGLVAREYTKYRYYNKYKYLIRAIGALIFCFLFLYLYIREGVII